MVIISPGTDLINVCYSSYYDILLQSINIDINRKYLN